MNILFKFANPRHILLLLLILSTSILDAGILTSQDSVKLILIDELRSGRSQKRSRVSFKVDEDIVDKDGILVIRKGTPAFGTVIRSRSAGAWGRRGIIEVEVNYTTAVDGQKVELRANKTKAGNKNKRLITSGAWLVAWPLAFLRGKNVVIKSGSNIVAWVDSNLNISDGIVDNNMSASQSEIAKQSPAWPDKFTLKNGDVIIGKMQQFKDGAYRVHTSAGSLTLKAIDVASVDNNFTSTHTVEKSKTDNSAIVEGDRIPIFGKSGSLVGYKMQVGISQLFYDVNGKRLTANQAKTLDLH